MSQTVLILGGSGRFGRHATDAFWNAGWRVRQFDRAKDDLAVAAKDVDVIVNAWNPTYDKWAAQVPGLHARVRAVAKAANATVILPGNVYVYGPDVPFGWAPETPHMARNPLGRIRIEMEAAYRQSGVRTVILRSGDFIDTQPSGNWFDMIMIPKIAKGVLTYPGDPTVPHAWAYLPDVARAAVELAEMREDLPVFADISFAGYTLSGAQMRAALERVMGHPIRLKKMNWLPIQVARPFWTLAKYLLEMRYLWSLPHQLNGAAFNAYLPDFQFTPVEQALAAAILPDGSIDDQVNPDQPVPAGRVYG